MSMNIFFSSCKTHDNDQNTTTDSSVPPIFFIADSNCRIDVASIANDIKNATISFTLSAQNLANTLECMAWGAADLIYAPCILLTAPPTLTLTEPSMVDVEVGCISLEDFTTDHITLFVTCTDKTTGLSTIKSLRSTDCVF